MIYYMGLIGFIVVGGMIFQTRKPYLKSNKWVYSFFTTMYLIILSGLRHRMIGADTRHYMDNFDFIVREYTWQDLWDMLKTSIVENSYDIRDVGYTIFVKTSQLFIPNSRYYLIFIAILIMVPMGWWIRTKSSNQMLSYIVFTCQFFPFYGLTGIRQILALILVSLFGYELILRRKFLPFLLLILLAMLFHKTAIIMLPFYFVYNIKLKKIYWYIALLGVCGGFIFRNSIAAVLNKIGGYSYEAYAGAGTYVFTVLIFGILLLCFLYYDRLTLSRPDTVHYINAVVIGSLLLPMSYYNPTFLRLGYYYFIYLILLIPEFVIAFKEKVLFKLLISAVLFLGFVKNVEPYRFFDI